MVTKASTNMVENFEQAVRDIIGEPIPLVNVKDYGAVGDGTTDDTVAIQDALDDANAQGVYGVIFPTGTYRTSDTLYYYSNSLIELNGSTILADLTNTNDGRELFSIFHPRNPGTITENVIIQNGTLNSGGDDSQVYLFKSYTDPNGEAETFYAAVVCIFRCQHVTLNNLTCSGAIYGGRVKMSQHIEVNNCVFHNNGDDGFTCSDKPVDVSNSHPERTNHLTLNQCVAYENGWDNYGAGQSGFEIDDGGSYIVLNHCSAYHNNHRGFDVHSHANVAGEAVDGVYFNNCEAYENNLRVGSPTPSHNGYSVGFNIANYGGTGVIMTNCISRGHNRKEVIAGGVSGTPVRARQFIMDKCLILGSGYNAGESANYRDDNAILVYQIWDVRIINCNITAATFVTPIRSYDCGEVTLENNIIRAVGRWFNIDAPPEGDTGRFTEKFSLRFICRNNHFLSLGSNNSVNTGYRPNEASGWQQTVVESNYWNVDVDPNLSTNRGFIQFNSGASSDNSYGMAESLIFKNNVVKFDTEYPAGQVLWVSNTIKTNIQDNYFEKGFRHLLLNNLGYVAFTGNTSFRGKEYNGGGDWGNTSAFDYDAGNVFLEESP